MGAPFLRMLVQNHSLLSYTDQQCDLTSKKALDFERFLLIFLVYKLSSPGDGSVVPGVLPQLADEQ